MAKMLFAYLFVLFHYKDGKMTKFYKILFKSESILFYIKSSKQISIATFT